MRGATVAVADTEASSDMGICLVKHKCEDRVISVGVDFDRGVVVSRVKLAITPGRPPPDYATEQGPSSTAAASYMPRKLFVLIVEVQKTGKTLPRRLLQLLSDPRMSLLAWDWDAGGEHSVRHTLKQQCGSQKLLGMDAPGQRQLALTSTTQIGKQEWAAGFYGTDWEWPSPSSGHLLTVGGPLGRGRAAWTKSCKAYHQQLEIIITVINLFDG